MAVWKIVVSDTEARKTYQTEIDQTKAAGVIGKKIGEEINGDVFGLSGYTLKITGGSDKDGFPMHPSVRGPGRKRVLLAGPPGFHPKIKGQRKRKTVCGDTVSESTMQINMKVAKKGEKPLAEMLGKPEKKTEAEAKPEEKKSKPQEEKPKEEKEANVEKVEGEKTN